MIEARDREERGRRLIANAALRDVKPTAHHTSQSIESVAPHLGHVTSPQKPEVPNKLPKTGPDRSDEPETWSPRARTRGS